MVCRAVCKVHPGAMRASKGGALYLVAHVVFKDIPGHLTCPWMRRAGLQGQPDVLMDELCAVFCEQGLVLGRTVCLKKRHLEDPKT